MENSCDNCYHFRHKSDNFGICDNLKNDTRVMSENLIMRLTNCDKEVAFEIHESIRYNKNFCCKYYEKTK